MGIDIEMYAEVFDGGRWRPAEPLVENEGYDPEDDPLQPRLRPQGLYRIRNRGLFAILNEDIRRADAGDRYARIEPRGLPDDVSPDILAFERPRHEDDLFGHTWLGLDELLAFDWKGRGGVNADWSETFEESAGPDFLERILPKLKSFGPPESVRIVFWYTC